MPFPGPNSFASIRSPRVFKRAGIFLAALLIAGAVTASFFYLRSRAAALSFNHPKTGLATAVGSGSTTITATNGTISGSTSLTVAAADTDVSVSSGNLEVTDTNGGGTNGTLTISLDGTNVRISDPNNSLGAGAGATQDGSNAVLIPLSSITSSIQVNTLAGNDTLTLNLAGGDFIPTGGLSFAGGDPTSGPGDKLVITGGSQGTVTYNYTNANDGNIVMSNFGAVSYTGLEPITNSGTASDVVFNLPAGPNVATLGDDGTTSNTLSRLSGATFETTDFANPTGSLTINIGNVADTITINALPDFDASLTLGSGANPLTTITFAGAVTLAANKNLAGSATSTISLSNAAGDIATSGTGTIALTTARDISLASGSSITTVNGALTLNANQQASPTSGNFVGIDVYNGLIRATGTGPVTVQGKGGNGSGGLQVGVFVRNAGVVRGGTSGALTVQGTGGAGTGNNDSGVYVTGTNSTITSSGGSVQVTGQGGGSGTAIFNMGVVVDFAGQVTAGGSGTVTVQGTGGASTGDNNWGVHVAYDNATITSGGGSVQVTGQGGGSGTSSNNLGVFLFNLGQVTAGGSGTVTVQGTGGATAGSVANGGVNVHSSTITSGGGNVNVTGIEGGGSSSVAIRIQTSGSITTAANGGTLTLIGNSMGFDATTTISAQNTSSVTLRQSTSGVAFDLGAATDPGGGPLGLSDAELDVITAGTLNIGDANSGPVTISGSIDLTDGPVIGTLNLVTGANVTETFAGDDLIVATLNITAPVGIGTAGGGALDIPGTTLSTNSTGANGDQYINGSGVVTVGANDLNAGLGTITLYNGGGGRFNTTSSGGDILSNVVVASGGNLGGNGAVSSTRSTAVNSGGTVAPGTSPGILNTGAVSFASGSTFDVEIGGTTPGNTATNHDQISVTGTVSLGGATLTLSQFNGFTPSAGDTFVIINNDSTDTLPDTFAGLPEGATISPFLGSATVNATITYQGGTDSNDVVLTAVPANTAPVMGVIDGDDAITVSEPSGTQTSPVQVDFPVTVSDPDDGQTLTFSFPTDGGPCGAGQTFGFANKSFVPTMVTASGGGGNTILRLLVDPNDAGSYCFDAEVTDGSATHRRRVTLTVVAANSSPTADNDDYATDENAPLNVSAPGVLQDDTDPDTGQSLTTIQVSPPSHASSFTLNSDGAFSYTPVAGFAGTDTFTYKARDNSGDAATQDSNTATVAITVNPTSCTPAPSDIVAWYPGDGNANDIQGPPFENGTIQGGATFAAGKVNQAFSFDGVDDAVFTNLTLNYSNGATLDAWIKVNGTEGGTVVSDGGGSSAHNGMGLFVESGLIRLYGSKETVGITNFVLTGPNVADGNWHHVAGTWTGTTAADGVHLYVDGSAVTVGTAQATVGNGTTPFGIGDTSHNFINFDGQIDEVEIFNRALSASEVQTIYGHGSFGKCRTCTTPPTGMVSWYAAEGNANDIAGPNNGTFAANTYATGKVGQAFSLDGIDDDVDVGDVDLPSTFTFDAWIKPGSIANSPFVIAKTDGVGEDSYAISMASTGKLVAEVHNASNAVTRYRTSNPVITTGAWQHIAVTYDGTAGANQKLRFYVNGVDEPAAADGTFDFGGAPKSNAVSARIGSYAGSFPLNGLVDETELFSRVLSATEIAAIANAGYAGKCHTSTFQFSSATYSIAENGSDATITVTRTGAHDTPAQVNFATTNGTATGNATCGAGYDYEFNSGTLSFAVNELSRTFNVHICNDSVYELGETVNLGLSAPSGTGASLGSPSTSVLTITNDDAPPAFIISDQTASEGSLPAGTTAFTFTITKTGPATEVAASVDYATADGSASAPSDYTAIPATTLSFLPNESSKQITVFVNKDTTYEANETFFVNLTNPVAATISDAQGIGTINNDDAPPATLVVNTTDDVDDGFCLPNHCSLREAINASNVNNIANTINFLIPDNDPGHVYYQDNLGAGVSTSSVAPTTAAPDTTVGMDPQWPHSWWTIAPTTSLPTIVGPVTIDGYFQTMATPNTLTTGDDAVLRIEIKGTSAPLPSTAGLTFNVTGAVLVKGLVINRFKNHGMNLANSPISISGNFIGTDVSGTLSLGNGVSLPSNGVNDGSGNTIGGAAPAARNIISGNTANGVFAGAGSTLRGNYIGTDRTGTVDLGNTLDGVRSTSSVQITVIGNLISGNNGDGLNISGGNSHLIQNNLVGTNAAGATALGNGGNGIRFSGGVIFATVGGTDPGEPNTIAFNGGDGVQLDATNGTQNLISGNSIFSNGTTSSHLGIDLDADGVTANDTADPDPSPSPARANNLQNFPVLNSASTLGTTTTITGTLNSEPSKNYTIEFFSNTACDTSGNGEGQTYVGSTTVMTDTSGNANITFSPAAAVADNLFITATATSNYTGNVNSTSEFSACRENLYPGTIQFSSPTYSTAENAGPAMITVTRTGGTDGIVSATFDTSNGTAIAGQDYTAVNSYSVSFANGDSANKTVSIPLTDDNVFESNETVNLALTSPQGGANLGTQSTAVLTITENDTAPTISISDVSMSEGNSGITAFTFTVSLSRPADTVVTVTANTADDSATQPSDYTSVSSHLVTFAALDTSETVTVNVNGDTTYEPHEQFFVNLTGESANSSILDGQGVGTILNDEPKLTITKTEDNSTVNAGEAIGFTMTVSNANDSYTATALSVALTDTLPTGTGLSWLITPGYPGTCAITTGVLNCAFGNLAAGASAQVHITSSTTFDSCGVYPNTASASATNHGSVQDDATTTVECPALTVAKTEDNAIVNAGSQIGFTIVVTNSSAAGTGTAKSVTLSDQLPSGTGVTWNLTAGYTGTCAINTGLLTCQFGDMAPGATATVHVYSGTSFGSCGTYANTATVSSTNHPDVTDDATTVVQCPALSVTKTADAPSVLPGNQIGFSVTVTNSSATGTSRALNVKINDPLPLAPGLDWEIDPTAPVAGCSIVGAAPAQETLVCDFPAATASDDLDAGESSPTVHVVSNTTSLSCGSHVNTASASADNHPSVTGQATTSVLCSDMTITKTHTGNFIQGQTGATYKITVSNTLGPSSSSGLVTVTDTVPAGLTATSINGGPNWICTQPSGPCTRSDALAVSTSYEDIILTVDVAGDAPASVTNTATVSGGSDSTPGNNSASDLTTIVSPQAAAWTLISSTLQMDEDSLNLASLNDYEFAFAGTNTGTVTGRANITLTDGISPFCPASSSVVSVSFTDSDGAGTDAQVLFEIRRSNILTGGNTVVHTFNSNAAGAPADTAWHSFTVSPAIDFDFTNNVYWIEVKLKRNLPGQTVKLGAVQIYEATGTTPCP